VPGLKSLPLGLAGRHVTLLSPSPALLEGAREIWRRAGATDPTCVVADPEDPGAAEEDSFDLVWSFCAFEHARDPERLAAAMVRASRRYVLVFVQNAWMPGVHVHRAHHWITSKPWDHGKVRLMSASAVASHLQRAGGRVLALGGCDLPPWPDIDVRLPRPRRRARLAPNAARPYGPGDPILSPDDAARVFATPARLSLPMQWLVRWHDRVEASLPRGLLRLLAHHPYVLAERVR
jgi:SAM-dependent methyltransferase